MSSLKEEKIRILSMGLILFISFGFLFQFQNSTYSSHKYDYNFKELKLLNLSNESEIVYSRKIPKTELASPEAKAIKNWTYMVYLCGDCNLEEFAIEDLNEMEYGGGTTADVNVIVLCDRCEDYDYSNDDWTTAKIFEVTADPILDSIIVSTELDDWGEVNMGDSEILLSFLDYCATNFPAENYALDIWAHGGGIYGVCFDEGYTLGNGRLDFSVSKKSGDNYLDVYDLYYALNNCPQIVDLVCFDSCLMGMTELAFTLSLTSSVMVASEETVPAPGYNYIEIIDELITNPSWTPAELGSYTVDAYENFYVNEPETQIAAIDLDEISTNLLGNLSAFADTLTLALTSYAEEIYTTRGDTFTFDFPEFIDIVHFADLIGQNVPYTGLDTVATQLINFIQNDCVINNYACSDYSGYANGLSIFMPEYYFSYEDYIDAYIEAGQTSRLYDFGLIDLLVESTWEEFLDAYYDSHDSLSVPPFPISLDSVQSDTVEWGEEHIYEVAIASPGVYEISCSVTSGDADLLLGTYERNEGWEFFGFSNLWNPDDGNTETIRLLLTETGNYYIRVQGFDNSNQYELVISAYSPIVMSVGSPETGSGGTYYGIYNEIEEVYHWEQMISHFFEIQLDSKYEYSIDLYCDDFVDYDLYFYDDSWTFLEGVDEGLEGADEYFFYQPSEEGLSTFYIEVFGFSGQGSFTLEVTIWTPMVGFDFITGLAIPVIGLTVIVAISYRLRRKSR